jgi:hypothetical protein
MNNVLAELQQINVGEDRKDTGSIVYTRHSGRRQTKHKNTQKNPHKTKKMSNKDPQKTRGEPIIMLAKSKQFLLLIRHPPCYSYILSRPTVNLLGDRGKKLHKKEMIHCHFRYGYFVTVNL